MLLLTESGRTAFAATLGHATISGPKSRGYRYNAQALAADDAGSHRRRS
jgi:hypothetical protein